MNSLTSSDYHGIIQLVIRTEDEIPGGKTDDGEFISGKRVENSIYNRWVIQYQGGGNQLSDFEGEVEVLVYGQDDIIEAHMRFPYIAASGSSCDTTLILPLGNYKVEVKAWEDTDCLKYYGIETDVEVGVGINQVDIYAILILPSIVIGNGSGSPGSPRNLVPVPVINCESDIAAFQFDLIESQDGIISPSACEVTSRVSHLQGEVEWHAIATDKTRYVFYFGLPDSGAVCFDVLPPGDGAVLNLYFDVDSSASIGTEVILNIDNVVIADENGDPITADYATSSGTFEIRYPEP
jgi:hypothetical protein